MAVVQKQFVIHNVDLKYSEDNPNPVQSSFTPMPVERDLEANNYPCPIVYVGAPMASIDTAVDVAISNKETTNVNELKKPVKRIVINVSQPPPTTTAISYTDTQGVEVKDPKEIFDIGSMMKAFLSTNDKPEPEKKPIKTQNMNLIRNSQSLVVNSTLAGPELYQRNSNMGQVINQINSNQIYNRFKQQQQYKQQQLQRVAAQKAMVHQQHVIKTHHNTQPFKMLVKDPTMPGCLRKVTSSTGVSARQTDVPVIRIPGLQAQGAPNHYIQSASGVNKVFSIKPNIHKVGNSVPLFISSKANHPLAVRTIASSTAIGSKPVVIKLVDSNKFKLNLASTIAFTPVTFNKSTVSSPTMKMNTVKPQLPTIQSPLQAINCRKLAPKSNPVTTATSSVTSDEPKAMIKNTRPSPFVNASPATISKLKRKNVDKFGADLIPSFKRLRTGVEITFEDGIRHFVTNIGDLLTMDDEKFKKWTDIKKGDVIAAKWTDGLHYDAKVVECYFDRIQKKEVEKKKEVERKEIKNTKEQEIEVKKPEEEEEEVMPKRELRPRPATSQPPPPPQHPKPVPHKAIMCDSCKLVFTKIKSFRLHQKAKCHSTGTPVSMDTFKVEMVDFASTKSKNLTKESFKKPINDKGEPMLKKGTKILHKWKLENGVSRWYQGTIKKVLGPDTESFECEFEVEYEGEDDKGIYKLYEDYPIDIRIVS